METLVDPVVPRPSTIAVVGDSLTQSAEDEILVALVRLHAEKVRPPRALWVPYELGRPFGEPGNAELQRQILAEALAGMAFVQLVRPGAPVVFGTFSSAVSMQSGAPTFGTPEPSMVLFICASLARRLGVPFRSGGGLCGSEAG